MIGQTFFVRLIKRQGRRKSILAEGVARGCQTALLHSISRMDCVMLMRCSKASGVQKARNVQCKTGAAGGGQGRRRGGGVGAAAGGLIDFSRAPLPKHEREMLSFALSLPPIILFWGILSLPPSRP